VHGRGVLFIGARIGTDGTSRMAARARGEKGQLSVVQRRSTHARCRLQRGRHRHWPRVRVMPSGVCLYAAVRDELARG
jgi:hypothetical protein